MKKTKTTINYEVRAHIAKALAHPSRLQILDLLQHAELNVNQLTEVIGCDQSTVSKHLSILKNVGLIKHRRTGTTHYYTIACGCLDGLFVCLENLIPKQSTQK